MAKKTHRTLIRLGSRSSVFALASCLFLSVVPLAAQAAGLGKVNVYSALGQPLRAEIELSATREELAGMKVNLASPEAFKQAGLDYATTLLSFKFVIDKRPSGQSIIRLSSDKPVNDPFVDMLLELNWPSGRLVREYTFLLDPPEVAAKAAPAVAPVIKSSAAAKPVESRPSVSVSAEEPSAKADTKPRAPAKAVEPAAEKTVAGDDMREVKRGDTLSKIAGEVKPEGVSLEQMLVGLYRANREAFDGGNMNRLKTGKILSVPDKSAVEAVTPGEAKKIVVAQASDWNAYRSKLAGAAAESEPKEGAAKQEAAGKISARVEEKSAPAAEPKDQVKVSRTEMGGKAGAEGKRSDEDIIAKEKALREANERLAVLEKNVADLQKLLEMKNQSLAEMQKQSMAKPVEATSPVAPAIAPAAPATSAPPAKPEPVVATKPAEAPALAEKPAEPVAKPEEVKPEVKPDAKPEDAPKPDAAPAPAPAPVAPDQPAPQPKKPVPPPPPPPEPSFLDELLDNPMALGGGALVLALLGGLFVAKRRKQDAKREEPLDLGSTLSQNTSLTANSVFRSTGGQSVDTSHTPVQTDFSQAGPGSIDTDEVDPVAEADVYMAYGRDAQAEEILLEAKQKDSKRYAIHLKLLEIYSNRGDTKKFEVLASELYSETSGVGADWEKAAAMGVKLDPQNPLYKGSVQTDQPAFDADATVIVTPQSLKDTATMPGQLSQIAEAAGVAAAPAVALASEVKAAPAELASLDFDLGISEPAPIEPEAADVQAQVEAEPSPLDFDLAAGASDAEAKTNLTETTVLGLEFSLPESAAAEPAAPVPAAKDNAGLDFDLGFASETVIAPITAVPEAETFPAETVIAPKAEEAASDLEFDVSLTESTFLGKSVPAPGFDMSSISLDLESGEAAPADDADDFHSTTVVNADFETAQTETVVNPDFGKEDAYLAPDFEINANEEITTKLDLAKAYEEMGDLEGARELLQEVLKEGDAGQREKAQALLAKVGA